MKHSVFYLALVLSPILFFGCSQYDEQVRPLEGDNQTPNLDVTQINGIGYYSGETWDAGGYGADFLIMLTGEFEGCLYVYVDEFDCSPSGAYSESGQEYFHGTYRGQTGSFWTTYKFSDNNEGCENGMYQSANIFHRCQHSIQNDSGEGVFKGVSGRINFKGNVDTGEFPYHGELRW